MVDPELRYVAFISYSSQDEAFAKRLQRTLEGYRILAGAGDVRIPGAKADNRAFPVFRDRSELKSGDLGAQIKASLDASFVLIVVCSPDAAASEWVNQEIREFVELGRQGRILAIVPDHVPATRPGHADVTETCFPPALANLADAEGDAIELLAADARQGHDGYVNAYLKLIAAMAGLDFGQLVNRDRIRRRRRAVQVGALVSLALAVFAGLGIAWHFENERAEMFGRDRLTAEMRSAFGAGDYTKATGILAHLAQTAEGDERAAFERVLAHWRPKLTGLADHVDEQDAVFQLNQNFYLKLDGNLHWLSGREAALAVYNPETRLAVTLQADGALHWNGLADDADRAGSSRPEAFDATSYGWRVMAPLKGGGLLLSGGTQSASAGGVEPVMWFFDPATKAHRLMQFGENYLDDGSILAVGDARITRDCRSIRWTEETLEETQDAKGLIGLKVVRRQTGRFAFGAGGADETVFEPSDPAALWDSYAIFDYVIAHCGAAPAYEREDYGGFADDAGDGVWPAASNRFSLWRTASAAAAKAQPISIDEVAARLRDGEPSEFGLDKEWFIYEDQPFPNSWEPYVLGQDGYPDIVISVGADGTKYARYYYCVFLPEPRMWCDSFQTHGNAGAAKVLGRYVAVSDYQYIGQPLFWLIDRETGALLEMHDNSAPTFYGPAPFALDVSPGGDVVAAPFNGGIRLYAFDENGGSGYGERLNSAPFSSFRRQDETPDAVRYDLLRFIDDDRLLGLTEAGELFALRISTDEILWRTSLAGGALQDILVDRERSRVGIAKGGRVEVIDLQTGLALEPQKRFEPGDDECASIFGAEYECLSGQRALQADGDGLRLQGSERAFLYAPAPAEITPADIATAPCWTGWRVADDRARPVDGLQQRAARPGGLPLDKLARCEID